MNISQLRIGNLITRLRDEEADQRTRGILTLAQLLAYRLQIQALENAFEVLDGIAENYDASVFKDALDNGVIMPTPQLQVVTTTLHDLREMVAALEAFEDLQDVSLVHLIAGRESIRTEVTVDDQVQRMVHLCVKPSA